MNLLMIVALVSALTSGIGAWQVQSWRQAARELERREAAHESFRQNELTARTASQNFEKDKAKNAIRTRTITVEVEKIVERPVYRSICLDDDGLLQLNNQIRRTDLTPSKPGIKLPRLTLGSGDNG